MIMTRTLAILLACIMTLGCMAQGNSRSARRLAHKDNTLFHQKPARCNKCDGHNLSTVIYEEQYGQDAYYKEICHEQVCFGNELSDSLLADTAKTKPSWTCIDCGKAYYRIVPNECDTIVYHSGTRQPMKMIKHFCNEVNDMSKDFIAEIHYEDGCIEKISDRIVINDESDTAKVAIIYNFSTDEEANIRYVKMEYEDDIKTMRVLPEGITGKMLKDDYDGNYDYEVYRMSYKTVDQLLPIIKKTACMLKTPIVELNMKQLQFETHVTKRPVLEVRYYKY